MSLMFFTGESDCLVKIVTDSTTSSLIFFLINNKVWQWAQQHGIIPLLCMFLFSFISSVTMADSRGNNIGV